MSRRDSTDDRAIAFYLAYPGSNSVDSFMLQHALWLSVSADSQIQLIMNRGWKSRTLIVALLHWLDYKT